MLGKLKTTLAFALFAGLVIGLGLLEWNISQHTQHIMAKSQPKPKTGIAHKAKRSLLPEPNQTTKKVAKKIIGIGTCLSQPIGCLSFLPDCSRFILAVF